MAEEELNISTTEMRRWKWQQRRDALLDKIGMAPERWREWKAIQEAQVREGESERLSPAELEKMVEFQMLAEDIEYRRNYFATTDLDKTLPGQFVTLIEELIGADPSIHSVMDIGVRYAFPDNVLASRHPGVQFIGVDFMPNLAEFNAEFRRDNLEFVSGYALDLLERDAIGADLVVFSATAIAIRNAELRNYLRLLSKRSRYVVFNELIYPIPGGPYVDPNSLPIDGSVATFIQPVPWAGHVGPICKTHPFAKMLAEAGYEVIKNRAFRPAWTSQFVVQAIGRRP